MCIRAVKDYWNGFIETECNSRYEQRKKLKYTTEIGMELDMQWIGFGFMIYGNGK
jgi:hypothetical protein